MLVFLFYINMIYKKVSLLLLSVFAIFFTSACFYVHAFTPEDFAAGAILETKGNAAFYRVELPLQVYLGSTSSLNDLQVFNAQGQSVSFARVKQYKAIKTDDNVFPARVFPLKTTQKLINNNNSMLVKSPDGTEIVVPLASEISSSTMTYLIDVSGLPEQGRAVSRLVFDWLDTNVNWQIKVNIYGGTSLASMTTIVAKEAPMMKLVSSGEHLQLSEVGIEQINGHRYWLIQVYSENNSELPELNAAEAITEGINSTQDEQIELLFTAEASNDPTVMIYSLPTEQPLSSLQISLKQQNRVLPLAISVRRNADRTWIDIGKTVVYQLNDENNQFSHESQNEGTVVAFNAYRVGQVRLNAINSGWGDQPPVVIGKRQKEHLVFNAAGDAPFTLAWGNTALNQSTSMNISDLLPNYDNNQKIVELLPEAKIMEFKQLGGEKRAVIGSGSWLTIVMWLVLILGVLGLACFAFSIWREISTTKNESDK